MTEPMTPADCDLRDFTFLPLEVVRFAQSDLVALEDPAAVLANILLWCASWHSVPAASLTNDDRVLARLAGYGRGVAEWSAVRNGALRGWVECSDGRLYHPVIAEKALDAWEGKLKQRYRTLCAAVRKHNERNPAAKVAVPTFDQWNDDGRPSSVTRDTDALSHTTDPNVTRDNLGQSQPRHADKGLLSHSSHTENRSKGQGQGQGQGDSIKVEGDAADAADRPYAFKGRIIRLVDTDLARWRKAYHTIPDLDAELMSLDAWLAAQPEEKQAKWFHVCGGALNRKHQETLASALQRSAGGDLELPIA